MLLSEIFTLIGKKCDKDKVVNKISIDSRSIEQDDVFICINSGYKYIDDAINRRASLIITEKKYNYDTDIKIEIVDDTIKVLGLIARYIRSKFNKPVIAITGSNGKTTTKELLYHILGSKYNVLKNEGSLNNHIGVPSTILGLNDKYDFLVLELGTNHPGEIAYLTDIVNPTVAIITNIGSSHIGNFKSLYNIYKEKISIKKDDTILFINGEDKYLNKCKGIKVYCNDYNYIPKIPYYKMNYYLVFKVCEYFNMDIKDIVFYADSFKINNSRMDYYNYGNITLIDDTYNASYESIVEGINSLDKKRRKVIILGDMLELGKYNEYLHLKLSNEIKKINNHFLITIGENTKMISSDYHFDNMDNLLNYLEKITFLSNDIIYVKGAHVMKMYKVVNKLKTILQKE